MEEPKPKTKRTRKSQRTNRPDYPTNYRKVRTEEGHTQSSIAYAMDKSPAVVFRIENGKKKIEMDDVHDLAEAIKKEPEETFRRLNGEAPVQNNTIDTNNGNCINVQQTWKELKPYISRL